MSNFFIKTFGLFLLLISAILLLEYHFSSPGANVFYFLNIQMVLFFGIKYLINKKRFSATKRGNVLMVTKNKRIIKKLELSAHLRIIKGINSSKIIGPDFEEMLYYSDFDKRSIEMIKAL